MDAPDWSVGYGSTDKVTLILHTRINTIKHVGTTPVFLLFSHDAAPI